MPTIASLNVNVMASTAGFSKAMTTASNKVSGFQRIVSSALAPLASFNGLLTGGGIALATKSMVSNYDEFNRSLTNSISIMDGVDEAMRKRLAQAAIDTAKTTKFAANDIAKSFMYLASSGLDAEQSLATMPVVAKFAQAGNFELENATNLLADAQSALGLKVKNTTQNMKNLRRVSDVLVKGNIISNSSVEDLSKALTNKAAAAIRALGKDMEEGVAVLAAFADQGTKGEEAGTGLNIVLRDLQNAALANGEAFKKNNIAVFDGAGEMRNIAAIVADMEQALNGLTDAQRKTTMTQLGFTDKSIAFTEILIGTSSKIREFEKALRSAGGATEQIVAKNMTPFEASLQRLRGVWNELAQVVGPPILNTLSRFNDNIAAITNTMLEFADPMRAFNEGFKNARDGIKGAEPELGVWGKRLKTVLWGIEEINKSLAKMDEWVSKLFPGGNGGGKGGGNPFWNAAKNAVFNNLPGIGPINQALQALDMAGEAPAVKRQANRGDMFKLAGNIAGKAARVFDNASDSLKNLTDEANAVANVFSGAFTKMLNKAYEIPSIDVMSGLGSPMIGGLGKLGLDIQDFYNKTKPINQGPELIRAGSEAAFNLNRGQANQQNQPINQVQKNTQSTVKELIDLNKAIKDGIKIQGIQVVDGFA